MLETFLIDTGSNKYLYSLNNRIWTTCDVQMEKMYYLIRDNYSSYDTMDKVVSNSKLHFSPQTIERYKLLNEKGFFSEFKTYNTANNRIKKEHIDKFISNINHIMIELTGECNLNCTYCSYGNLYNKDIQKQLKGISYEKVKVLLDFILLSKKNPENHSSKDVPLTISFYGGEPLVEFSLIKRVVDYCEKKHIKVKYKMTTNGLLLNNYIDFFVEKDFSLLISLDGNAENNKYRLTKKGTNSHKIVEKNALSIKSKYPIYFQQNVNFNSVYNDTSYLKDIYQYFEDNFNKTPSVGEISRLGIKEEKLVEFNKIFKSSRECFGSLKLNKQSHTHPNYTKILKFIFNFSNNVYYEYGHVDTFLRKLKPIPSGTCLPFGRKLFISAEGKIGPCQFFRDKPFGEANNKRVIINYDNILTSYNDSLNDLYKQCNTCFNVLACDHCFLIMQKKKDKLYCPYHMNYKKMNEYLNERFSVIEDMNFLYSSIVEEAFIQ